MTRFFFALAAFVTLAISLPVSAQVGQQPFSSGTVTITTSGASVIGPLAGETVCTLDVSGTWTGPINITGFSIAAARSIALKDAVNGSSAISANGFYSIPLLGSTNVSLSAAVSGSASVTYFCSQGLARSGGGGSSATLVSPIYSPAPNQIGFDYTQPGTFAARQQFGAGGALPSPCESPGNASSGTYITSNKICAVGGYAAINSLNPHDSLSQSSCDTGADGFFWIGTNDDGPMSWITANINGQYTFSACWTSTIFGHSFTWNSADVYHVFARGSTAYVQFQDVNFPVELQSAVGHGGCAQLNGTTGALSSTGQPCAGIQATCASVSTTGTACTFPNAFAFADTAYTCTLGVVGTTPTATSYVATSTTQVTLRVASGTASVAYRCSE